MKNDKKTNVKVLIAYISVCLVWGSTYLAMRIAVSYFPPELFAGIRFLCAGAIVLIFAIISKCDFPNSFGDVVKAAIPGVFLLIICNGLVIWTEQWVYSGITAVLLSTSPIFVALFEPIFFKYEKKSIFEWVCIVMGFLGTLMLVVSGTGIGSINIFGALIILIAALSWSLGSIYSKKVKYSGHITSHIGIQMLTAGIVLTAIGFITGEVSRVQINNNVLLALGYLIVFGSIIGYSSNMYVLSKWPATIAITSTYINPIVAVLLGALILNETVDLKMIIFMIITIGSVIGLHLKKQGIVHEIKSWVNVGKI